MKDYLKYISESRYKTHGLECVKRTIPKLLKSLHCDFNIEYNHITDDFGIYFNNLTTDIKNVFITRIELLGYYPSVFVVDDIDVKDKNVKDIDLFVKYIKDYNLNKINKVYIQMESWLDEVVETPPILYHVCRTIDKEKIKRYGLSPRSKHKISYHPDRIYLVDNYTIAENIMEQLKITEKDNNNTYKYSILEIKPEQKKLNLRKNFNLGLYSTQNILPIWISQIIDF